MLLTLLTGALISVAAPTAAQPVPDNCRDDRGQDRCAPAKQAEMRTLYGVAPIEKHAADKSQVRRIYYVDGYGGDVVAIEFIRAAGQDASVRVYHSGDPVMESKLTEGAWNDLISRSAYFDRSFASAKPAKKPKKGEEEIRLCMHSWVYWIEASDPSEKSRNAVEDACNDSPTEPFAWEAAKAAVAAIPYCSALDRKFHRNDAKLLAACGMLRGDRLAAAKVFNRAQGFRFLARPGGLDDLGYDIKLDFQGTKTERMAAKDYWASMMKEPESPDFYIDGINGLSNEKAVAKGSIVKMVNEDKYESADVEMIWEEDGGTFYLASISVGPYRPFTPSSE